MVCWTRSLYWDKIYEDIAKPLYFSYLCLKEYMNGYSFDMKERKQSDNKG